MHFDSLLLPPKYLGCSVFRTALEKHTIWYCLSSLIECNSCSTSCYFADSWVGCINFICKCSDIHFHIFFQDGLSENYIMIYLKIWKTSKYRYCVKVSVFSVSSLKLYVQNKSTALSGIFVMDRLCCCFCKVAEIEVINCISLKKVNQKSNLCMESGYVYCISL